jgi:hypothetical protein
MRRRHSEDVNRAMLVRNAGARNVLMRPRLWMLGTEGGRHKKGRVDTARRQQFVSRREGSGKSLTFFRAPGNPLQHRASSHQAQ